MGLIKNLLQIIKPNLVSNRKVSVMYGYPKGRNTWLTIYHKRRTDDWVFEWDDLFDSGRPRDWGNMERVMNKDKKSGATEQEHEEAKRRLKSRGLW